MDAYVRGDSRISVLDSKHELKWLRVVSLAFSARNHNFAQFLFIFIHLLMCQVSNMIFFFYWNTETEIKVLIYPKNETENNVSVITFG